MVLMDSPKLVSHYPPSVCRLTQYVYDLTFSASVWHWKEDYLEPGPQYLPPGYDTHAAPSGMTEEPVSTRGTYTSSETPRTSTGEGYLQLGQINQVIHYNSVQNPTDIKIDSENLS